MDKVGSTRPGVMHTTSLAMERFLAEKNSQVEAMCALFNHTGHSQDMTISREDWEASFDTVDRNKDGNVSRKEFYIRLGQTHLFDVIAGSHKAAISRKLWCDAFDMLDTNHDGTISFQEWENVGVKTWEVKRNVHVFAEPDTQARKVASKTAGDRVRGRSEGIWVRLVDEAGFMLSATLGSAELAAKSLKELKKQMEDDGIKKAVIDTIDEADNPKQHAIFLLEENRKKMAAEEKQNAAEERGKAEKEQILKMIKRKELKELNLKELKQRAREMGIDQECIEEADDKNDPRMFIVRLIQSPPKKKPHA